MMPLLLLKPMIAGLLAGGAGFMLGKGTAELSDLFKWAAVAIALLILFKVIAK